MSSSNDFQEIFNLKPKFEKFGFTKNPFTIDPLFTNLNDEAACSRDKDLFVTRPQAEDAAKALEPGRRILIYGEVGTGKSTILNLLLYLGCVRDKYLPIRVLISEQNVERAVQEILYTVCMEIISEIKQRKMTHPVDAMKKWVLEKRKSDDFYDYMSRLIGVYEEEKATKEAVKGTVKGKIGTGAVPGGEVAFSAGGDESVETKFKTRVETLPSKVVEKYFEDMIEAAEHIGFKNIIIGLDEADHIVKVEKVVAMLTVARGIFFSTKKPIFVIAGSMDLSKQADVVNGVFDSTICVGQVPMEAMEKILDKRIKEENKKQAIGSVFEEKAIEAIFNFSGGFPKDGLRLAANALTEAAIENQIPVKQVQVSKVQAKTIARISETLDPSELVVFNALREIGESSPSNDELLKTLGLSRPQLDKILRNLWSRNVLQRRKEGKAYKYYM